MHWEDPTRTQPDDARVGDPVTLLVCERRRKEGEAPEGDCGNDNLKEFGVMFCPHAPAPVVRTVDDGLQVLVPESSRTGPIAIVKKTPDLTMVKSLITEYAGEFPVEWNSSVFASVRMDVWAFPDAFGSPILEIMPTPKQRGNGNHPQNPQQPKAGTIASGPNNPSGGLR